MKAFRPADVFSPNMILQRRMPVQVYGSGADGVRITASCGGASATCTVADGRWLLMLPPMEAATGLTLTLEGGGDRYAFTGVSCGEVFLAGGQSNMQYSLSGAADGHAEFDASAPPVHMYTVPRNLLSNNEVPPGYEFLQNRSAGWRVAGDADDRATAAFSAVGYLFAREAAASFGVPVGIISCNWGGSGIFSWLAPERIAGDPSLAPVLGRYSDWLARYDADAYHDRFLEFADAYRVCPARGEDIFLYYEPPGPYSFLRPGGLYGSMLRGVLAFTVRGLLWYQGECEAMNIAQAPDNILFGAVKRYPRALEVLHEQMRDACGNPGCRLLMVQLPPWTAADIPLDWAGQCDNQRAYALGHEDCRLVTTGDCGGPDVHPPVKREIGRRLARAALDDEGRFCGPLAEAAAWEPNGPARLAVRFRYLRRPDLRGPVAFELETPEGVVSAEPRWDGSRALLDTGGRTVLAVRYEYRAGYDIALYNEEGLPASPFRLEPVPPG